MSLGSIIVRLTMDTATFDTDAGRAAKIAKKRADEIDASFRKAGKAIGFALGAGIAAVATGLTVATKAAIDNADAIRDLSIRTGVGTEKLSEYAYAASQTGTDIETVGRGIKILSKNMADALNPTNANAKVFEALGINVKDATGHLKNAADIIPELANKISGMKDGTEKAALMLQLFGKAGLDLTEFMNQGGAGLDAFAEKARSLGIVIDEKTAAAADSFKDKLGDLHAVVGGLGLGIARELLPALESTIDRLIELVKQGGLASDIASVLSASFSFVTGVFEGYAKAVDITSTAIEYLINLSAGLKEVEDNMQSFGLASGSVAGGIEKIKAATAAGDAALFAIHHPAAAARAPGINRNRGTEVRGTGQWADVNMTGSEVELKKLLDALANNKGTKTGGGSKARKSELTDEQKAAKQLADEYTRLTASMQERIGLFGAETEVAKTTYDVEQGSLKALSQSQKDTLLSQAQELDALKEKQDLMAEGKALIESILTPTEQVNKQIAEAGKLLAAGAIAQADYNKAVAGYRTPAQDVIDGLQEEIRLLGMTNEQQDLYNALKYAGADATKAQIDQITGLIHAREQAAAAADLQREVESQLSDAIFDFATGAKSAKEAAEDFFDSMAKYILRMISENWAKQIVSLFGGGQQQGGGTSTNWLSMLVGLFGGARAYGGTTNANTAYWVGERGPELFVPQSSGTVIPADTSARMARGGNGVTMVVNNNYKSPESPYVREQVAAKQGAMTNLALRRNGR